MENAIFRSEAVLRPLYCRSAVVHHDCVSLTGIRRDWKAHNVAWIQDAMAIAIDGAEGCGVKA